MKIQRLELWEQIPGTTNTQPHLVQYEPEEKITDNAILILPGSGYKNCPSRPKQEGDRVARYLCEKGFQVFVLVYRVHPDLYPLPLLDGRRAVRYLRYHKEELGIQKIAALGYSSGGHLTATLSSYLEPIEMEDLDEIDKEDFTPDFQALSYPVISITEEAYYSHRGSAEGLLNDEKKDLQLQLSLDRNTVEQVPPTFIWHNFDDKGVSVVNSLRYAENLRQKGASVEIHIFPDGGHGIGLPVDDRKDYNHAKIWLELFVRWLAYHEFVDDSAVKL